jgi:hypothetical protein
MPFMCNVSINYSLRLQPSFGNRTTFFAVCRSWYDCVKIGTPNGTKEILRSDAVRQFTSIARVKFDPLYQNDLSKSSTSSKNRAMQPLTTGVHPDVNWMYFGGHTIISMSCLAHGTRNAISKTEQKKRIPDDMPTDSSAPRCRCRIASFRVHYDVGGARFSPGSRCAQRGQLQRRNLVSAIEFGYGV